MCTYSNDCSRFCDLLQDQTGVLDSMTEAGADRVSDVISDCVMLFSSLGGKGVDAIVDVMCGDIEEELLGCLFTDIPSGGDSEVAGVAEGMGGGDGGAGAGGLGIIVDMLAEYIEKVGEWLCDTSLVAMVLKKSLARIVKFYLESLLKAQPKIDADGEVMKQVREDARVLGECFEE
jgi:hypothetical protein